MNTTSIIRRLVASVVLLWITSTTLAQTEMKHMHHQSIISSRHIFLQMMDTMMISMEQGLNLNNIESAFLQSMIPHHQGAISMAKYEIANGKTFEMVQLAKSILAEQQSEVTQMRFWLQQSDSIRSIHIEFTKAMYRTMDTMMQHLPASEKLQNIDQAFASIMLPHHQAAVEMAKAILAYSKHPQILAFAKMLIANEQIEIAQMSTYIYQL